jgi:hypothetical protein
MSMQYQVAFYDDDAHGLPLAGTLYFLSSTGGVLGSWEIDAGLNQFSDSTIPEGTTLFKASSPGFSDVTTAVLQADTEFHFTKGETIGKYVAIGAVLLFAGYLLLK